MGLSVFVFAHPISTRTGGCLVSLNRNSFVSHLNRNYLPAGLRFALSSLPHSGPNSVPGNLSMVRVRPCFDVRLHVSRSCPCSCVPCFIGTPSPAPLLPGAVLMVYRVSLLPGLLSSQGSAQDSSLPPLDLGGGLPYHCGRATSVRLSISREKVGVG